MEDQEQDRIRILVGNPDPRDKPRKLWIQNATGSGTVVWTRVLQSIFIYRRWRTVHFLRPLCLISIRISKPDSPETDRNNEKTKYFTYHIRIYKILNWTPTCPVLIQVCTAYCFYCSKGNFSKRIRISVKFCYCYPLENVWVIIQTLFSVEGKFARKS